MLYKKISTKCGSLAEFRSAVADTQMFFSRNYFSLAHRVYHRWLACYLSDVNNSHPIRTILSCRLLIHVSNIVNTIRLVSRLILRIVQRR